MLIAYLKDHQLLKVDHVTPYGYRIDFVLHFDKNRKPVPTPPEIDTINDGLDKYKSGTAHNSRMHSPQFSFLVPPESPFCCSNGTPSARTITDKCAVRKFCANVISRCSATKWCR